MRAQVLVLSCLLCITYLTPTFAEELRAVSSRQPNVSRAPYDDYQNMLDRLGIKKMRRGRNGRGRDTSNEATAAPRELILGFRLPI